MKSISILSLASLFIAWSAAAADSPQGYLGIYAKEVAGGVQITGFIAGTAAASLAAEGVLARGDVITKIGATNISTIKDIQTARATIPVNKQAKMVLRNAQGELYHVWVSRPVRSDILGIKSGGGGGVVAVPPVPSSQPAGAAAKGGGSPPNATGATDAISRSQAKSSGLDSPPPSKGSAAISSNDAKRKSESSPAAGLAVAPANQLSDLITKGDKGDGGKAEFRDTEAARSPQSR